MVALDESLGKKKFLNIDMIFWGFQTAISYPRAFLSYADTVVGTPLFVHPLWLQALKPISGFKGRSQDLASTFEAKRGGQKEGYL